MWDRNVLGSLSLAEILRDRDQIGEEMCSSLQVIFISMAMKSTSLQKLQNKYHVPSPSFSQSSRAKYHKMSTKLMTTKIFPFLFI